MPTRRSRTAPFRFAVFDVQSGRSPWLCLAQPMRPAKSVASRTEHHAQNITRILPTGHNTVTGFRKIRFLPRVVVATLRKCLLRIRSEMVYPQLPQLPPPASQLPGQLAVGLLGAATNPSPIKQIRSLHRVHRRNLDGVQHGISAPCTVGGDGHGLTRCRCKLEADVLHAFFNRL